MKVIKLYSKIIYEVSTWQKLIIRDDNDDNYDGIYELIIVIFYISWSC